VLDGLGDRPHPDTGGVSPLVAAATPNLDRLARSGLLGQVSLLGAGVAPESDAGVLALLGYDPVRDSPGRGVLEALGIGIPLAPGDVAFRMNFATAEGDGRIVDSRVGRSLSTAEAKDLARALNAADVLADRGIRAEVRPTVGHRGVLWLHPTEGSGLSPEVSNSDPFYEKTGGMGHARAVEEPRTLPVRPLDGSPEAARTAEAVNAWLERVPGILAGHRVNAQRALRGGPLANAILLRHAGSLPKRPVTPFRGRYGFEGAALTEMPVERGIAGLLGLADVYVGPMGPDRDASLRDRAERARESLDRQPFLYAHLKGPDEPGHDGDALRKKAVIEAIDRSFFGPFLDGLDLSRTRLAITADHSTPCILKRHSDDPVPLLIAGARGARSEGAAPVKFGEPDAARGALGTLRGGDVLPTLFLRERSPAGAST
jgi:2,3-bisphosphoglycerate-independent phosphoglycerate mutase